VTSISAVPNGASDRDAGGSTIELVPTMRSSAHAELRTLL
jgi:hypothetical protein